MLWLLAACADDCATMCDAALARYEACMPERGLSWGVAYTDAADYQNACATWVWEQEQLGEAPACVEMTRTFDDGTCEEYDAAW